MPTDLTIPALDGYRLAASRFDPPGMPEAVVLISPATGVKRSVYRGLAEHLARAGFAVLTWDWRGTGGSKPVTLRGFPYTMRDWAELDLAGVIAAAEHAWPGVPVTALGHSFGGQAFGLTPHAGRLRAAVTVAAQSGYWGHYRFPNRWLYAALFYVLMPGLTTLVGWFPSARLGLGEDLPPGVARQWASWCRSPDYLGDWAGHARFAAPMLVWGFTDDPYASPAAVAALHDRYTAAPQTRRILTPGEAGQRRVGHFGFFRPGMPALWDETATWLRGVI